MKRDSRSPRGHPRPTSTRAADIERSLLARVIAPEAGDLPLGVARALLRWQMHDSDVSRMNWLAERRRHGHNTPDEQSELEAYDRVEELFSLLHAKARRSLRIAQLREVSE